MRIIAGRLKGRRVASPSWEGLRPTSDRLRETLFNVLAPRVEGARVLDVFAGTGALGFEALSRGAAHVVFVESDRRAADGDSGQVFGELSYSLDFRDFSVEGFSELAYARLDSDALGAQDSQRDEIGYSTFGLRGTTRIERASGRRLTARISSGWRHAFSDSRLEDESGAAVALTRDAFRLDMGLDYQLGEALYAGLFNNGTYAEDARDNGMTARLSLRF